MTAEIKTALAEPRKTMAERCTKWIRGQQCDNYRAVDSNRCAMHTHRYDERQREEAK